MSADSSGANDGDSSYLESHKNSPGNHDTTMNISTIIEEIGNLHKVVIKDLVMMNSPRSI